MAKYEPLERYLRGLDRGRSHTVSFAQVEQILARPLPPSARAYQAWWANQRGAGHTQAHSWMGAGWHTVALDLTAKQVTFRPVALPRAPTRRALPPRIVRPLTIEEAKAAVAMHLGVRAQDVEITIRD